MCDFCNHIVEDSEVGWVDNNIITYDRRFDDFSIQTADGGILQDVKFCPYYGEKLKFMKGENDD